MKKKFKNLISFFRNEQGIKQETLAEQVGITASNLSLIENGWQEPKASTLQKIAKNLNSTMEDLIIDKE